MDEEKVQANCLKKLLKISEIDKFKGHMYTREELLRNIETSEEDNIELWETRKLGASEEHVKVSEELESTFSPLYSAPYGIKAYDLGEKLIPSIKTSNTRSNCLTKDNSVIWTDNHYNFTYDISNEECEIKIDPYFVSNMWKLGDKDNTGCIFHILKTIARYGTKNSKEREIKALHAQIKRLAELEGVQLD